MSSQNLIEWLDDTNAWIILSLGLFLNVFTNLVSAILWRLVVGKWGERDLTRRDLLLTASSTVVNAAVILPAWLLWKSDYLVVASLSFGRAILETIYLLVVLDLVMYCAHRLFHYGFLYRWFHGWHHAEDEPTSVLLFVMNPAEALGFGAALVVAMTVWPVSVPAVSVFIAWNLLFGTFAHIPTEYFRSGLNRLRPLVWISKAHQRHHAEPMTNFAFFSPVWDRLAGTTADR